MLRYLGTYSYLHGSCLHPRGRLEPWNRCQNVWEGEAVVDGRNARRRRSPGSRSRRRREGRSRQCQLAVVQQRV